MEAELLGIFVEDINLVRLAELPFTHQVHASATQERLDSPKMERQLKVQAEQARRALEEAAQRRNLRWSFRTVRGQVTLEVLAAAVESDLLTLGKSGRPLTQQSHLGSTALAAAIGGHGAVLLTESTTTPLNRVLVTYCDSDTARWALKLAAELAAGHERQLVVLLSADDRAALAELERQVASILSDRAAGWSCRPVARRDAAALTDAVHQAGGGLLILHVGDGWLRNEEIHKAVEQIDGPVLLVR
jgi:hypothetical protein